MSKKKKKRVIESGWPKRKPTDFGNRLGFLLAEKDLSLTEVAEKLGISKQAVHYYKYAEYPNSKTIHKIARALDVSVYFFFVDDWVDQYNKHSLRAIGPLFDRSQANITDVE